MDAPPTPEESRWFKGLWPLFDAIPSGSFEERIRHYSAARDSFLVHLAQCVGSDLRRRLREGMPQTAAAKTELAKEISDDLSRLGLAVQCQRTRRPAKLVVDDGGEGPTGKGYFALEVEGPQGRPVRTVDLRRSPPHLVLMPNGPEASPPPPERFLKPRHDGQHSR